MRLFLPEYESTNGVKREFVEESWKIGEFLFEDEFPTDGHRTLAHHRDGRPSNQPFWSQNLRQSAESSWVHLWKRKARQEREGASTENLNQICAREHWIRKTSCLEQVNSRVLVQVLWDGILLYQIDLWIFDSNIFVELRFINKTRRSCVESVELLHEYLVNQLDVSDD